MASVESAKMTGKCECPKKQSGKSVWRKTFNASSSPKMYASSSTGVPGLVGEHPSTTTRALGRDARPRTVSAGELRARPQRGFERHAVEQLALFQARAHLVVVAADRDQRPQRAQQVDRLGGGRAVADHGAP